MCQDLRDNVADLLSRDEGADDEDAAICLALPHQNIGHYLHGDTSVGIPLQYAHFFSVDILALFFYCNVQLS